MSVGSVRITEDVQRRSCVVRIRGTAARGIRRLSLMVRFALHFLVCCCSVSVSGSVWTQLWPQASENGGGRGIRRAGNADELRVAAVIQAEVPAHPFSHAAGALVPPS